MATIAEIREKYPQYKDLSDEQLADGLYKKHYADMPRDEFNTKIGLREEKPGYLSQQWEATKEVGKKAVGVAEAGVNLAGGLLAFPGQAIAGAQAAGGRMMEDAILGRGVSLESAAEASQKAQEDVTPLLQYQPRTERGRQYSEAASGQIGNVMEFVAGGLGEKTGVAARKLGASPGVEAIAEVVPKTATELYLFKKGIELGRTGLQGAGLIRPDVLPGAVETDPNALTFPRELPRPKKVTISIPGDGEFEIPNHVESLSEFRRRVEKMNQSQIEPTEKTKTKLATDRRSVNARLNQAVDDAIRLYGSAQKATDVIRRQISVAKTGGAEGKQVDAYYGVLERLSQRATQEAALESSAKLKARLKSEGGFVNADIINEVRVLVRDAISKGLKTVEQVYDHVKNLVGEGWEKIKEEVTRLWNEEVGGGPEARKLGKEAKERLTEPRMLESKLNEFVESLTRPAQMLGERAAEVKERGTFVEEKTREEFRKAGRPEREETFEFQTSEKQTEATRASAVAALGKVAEARDAIRKAANGNPALVQAAQQQMAELIRLKPYFEKIARETEMVRHAQGRQVKLWDSPVSPELADRLRGMDELMVALGAKAPRLPIDTSIARFLSDIVKGRKMSPGRRREFYNDLVNSYRFNFPLTSWTLDLISNAAEGGAQMVGGLGFDMAHAAKSLPKILSGDAAASQGQMPAMRGWLSAIRYSASHFHKPINPNVEAKLFTAVQGEKTTTRSPGFPRGTEPGVYTLRTNRASRAWDTLRGLGLYLKGAQDGATRRVAAEASLFRDASVEAEKMGLRGADREAFMDRFVEQTSDEMAVKRAAEAGNKAGFSRELSEAEERMANSLATKLFVAQYPRWGFQFGRWAAEMIGVNPKLWKEWKNGSARAEDVAAYFAKSATGLGGLYLVSKLYNSVDAKTGEYVKEDGQRVRLAGREPILSALWMVAMMKGDWDKAIALSKLTSFPVVNWLQNGIVSEFLLKMRDAQESGRFNARGTQRELYETLNHALPGAAILAALKSVFDPTLREPSLVSELPGLSRTQPERMSATTGESIQPMQRIPGTDTRFRAIRGVPVPGLVIERDPIYRLFAHYGMLEYRRFQMALPGVPKDAPIPPKMTAEFEKSLGKWRKILLMDIAKDHEKRKMLGPPKRDELYEAYREMIADTDRMAAEMAATEVALKTGMALPERKLTTRERLGASEPENAFAE